MLANDATRHNAGALHVNMRLGKALFRAAVRTLSLCSRNIYRENFAQFPGGSVTVTPAPAARPAHRADDHRARPRRPSG